MEEVGQKLKDLNIKYTKTTVEDEEKGTAIDKLIFFNDPDGFMIEICNCENLKLLPAGSLGKVSFLLIGIIRLSMWKTGINHHNISCKINDNKRLEFARLPISQRWI